ncbi:MAG: hypothetical protein NVSMB65_12520 [Chloroflexota bacterium]
MDEPETFMGLTVQASDGEAGRVIDVLVEEQSGRLGGLVVQGRGFFGKDVVVPAAAIDHRDGGRVYVHLNRQEAGQLPVYSAGQFGAAQGLVSATARRFDRQSDDNEGRQA